MQIFKVIKKFQKKILTVALAAGLLVATGFAGLNLANVSAQLTPEPSPSAQLTPSPNVLPEEADGLISKRLDMSKKFINDRLTVKFKEGVSDEEKREIAKSFGAKVVREDLNLLGSKVLRVKSDEIEKTVNDLKADPKVVRVSKVSVGKIDCANPDDPDYCVSGRQWGLGKISAPAGWAYSKGSSTVTVAVIDTGITSPHQDLPGGRLYLGRNHVTPGQGVEDNIGHGTAVAGIIAASTNNATLMAGVNWNVKLLAIKAAGDDGYTDANYIASAINEAANEHSALNVKVINISASLWEDTPDLWDAVQNARSKGIIIVATAKTNDPMNGETWNCLTGVPAAYPLDNVIAVVAIDQNDNHVYGCTVTQGPSWGGGWISLAAPGKDIWSLNKDGGSQGGYSGTSFAAPFVSGVASILSSCSGTVANDLKNGAVDIGAPGYDSLTGWGKVNLWKALVQSCNTMLGDVSCSGAVTATDALFILRYVAQLASAAYSCPVNVPHEIYFPEADVNGDGAVTAVDALFVKQYVAGIRNLQSQSLIAPAVDSDGDGMTDQQEAQFTCLNPNVADAILDFDGDNLNNSSEIVLGSNPCIGDTDGDGFTDYAEFWVGTDPVLRCGENAWPADFVTGGIPDSTNRVNIMDLTSFLAPVRRLDTSPGDPGYDRRWDLVPGKGVFAKDINISDLTALLVLAPPMFNGQRAFNGPVCTP